MNDMSTIDAVYKKGWDNGYDTAKEHYRAEINKAKEQIKGHMTLGDILRLLEGIT